MTPFRRSLLARPLSSLVVLASLGLGPASRGDTYAFLVGVSKYENNDRLPSLRYADQDVVAFGGVLRNSGVPNKNIVTLSYDQPNPRFKPTRRNIQTEFHLLLATLEPEDALIVALAGHGVQIGAESYFLPTNADPANTDTLISIKADIYDEMQRSQAGRKLLLVDACRNDPQTSDNSRSAGVTPLPLPRSLVSNPVPQGIAALFSCNKEQKSFEDPVLRHGVFFYQVIQAWTGEADSDRDGQVTLQELETFVRRETKNHARDALQQIQTPVFQPGSIASGGWVLTSLSAARPRSPENGPQTPPENPREPAGTPQALGRSYMARGQFAEAVRAYSEAIRLDPNDARAYFNRAVALGAAGKLPAALEDYDQALRLNPRMVVAYVGKGAVLGRLDRLDEAIRVCSHAITLDPNNARAYFNRGIVREARKDKLGAAQDFQKAAQLDPSLKAR
jgi:tetratricopeptide (TPR) repeat protein